jgi:hypothetical protein
MWDEVVNCGARVVATSPSIRHESMRYSVTTAFVLLTGGTMLAGTLNQLRRIWLIKRGQKIVFLIVFLILWG